MARKTADQSLASSTTLTDETDLQIALEAGKTYQFIAVFTRTSRHSHNG